MKYIDIGPRQSGKTTRALQLLRRCIDAGLYKRVILVCHNYQMANNYCNGICQWITDTVNVSTVILQDIDVEKLRSYIASSDNDTIFVFDEVRIPHHDEFFNKYIRCSYIYVCFNNVSKYYYIIDDDLNIQMYQTEDILGDTRMLFDCKIEAQQAALRELIDNRDEFVLACSKARNDLDEMLYDAYN